VVLWGVSWMVIVVLVLVLVLLHLILLLLLLREYGRGGSTRSGGGSVGGGGGGGGWCLARVAQRLIVGGEWLLLGEGQGDTGVACGDEQRVLAGPVAAVPRAPLLRVHPARRLELERRRRWLLDAPQMQACNEEGLMERLINNSACARLKFWISTAHIFNSRTPLYK